MKRALHRRLLVVLALAAATGNLVAAACFDVPKVTPPAEEAQIWTLTNDVGDVATVTVTPFTSSGTFSETSSSAGWYVRLPGCTPYRLRVGGNIVHTSGGDRWSFVGLSGSGCGSQTLGSGGGTANGSFPNATAVSGSITATTQSPLGTATGQGSFTGRRL